MNFANQQTDGTISENGKALQYIQPTLGEPKNKNENPELGAAYTNAAYGYVKPVAEVRN